MPGSGNRARSRFAAPEHHLTSPPDAGGAVPAGVAASAAVAGGAAFAERAMRTPPTTRAACRPNVPDVEPHARRADPGVALRRSVEVRGERQAPREPRAHAHAAFVGGVHAAAEPVRHHHAVGPALRAPSRGHPGHRPAPAPADDPRPRRAIRASTRWTTSCAFRRCRASISSNAARTPAWSGATSRCRRCSTRTACCRCSEWTGVPLSTLLDEVGIDRKQATLRAGRGRRRRVADAHDPDRHGARRRAGLLRPERRDAASGAGLSAAAARAGRAGRVERQVAAPASRSATSRGTRARSRCTTST